MQAPRYFAGFWLAACLLLAPAQQPAPPSSAPLSSTSLAHEQSLPSKAQAAFYRDLDLLRASGFSHAEQATVSVRIFDQAGATPPGLLASDFQVTVNGTRRSMRVHAPGSAEASVSPMVLLVLPPNQPIVHSIALKNAEKYFASQPQEALPWRVGIFDSSGKLTPFTNGRTQLLAYLTMVEHAPEPLQFASSVGLAEQYRWDGGWLRKAEEAIGMMQRFDGPKVILAINPISEPMYGLNEQMFAHGGPETLVGAAHEVGAHIYVAKVGGPEVYVIGGDASQGQPAQTVGPGGLQLGSLPSYHMQVDPQMVASLNYFAFRDSMMMQSAADTMGGFSNSLSELAGKIHQNLDGNYALEFDLEAGDTDRGTPAVEVRLARHDLKVAIMDVLPIGSAAEAARDLASKRLMESLRKDSALPVASSDYAIVQHVDSFPLRGGLEPYLPMSCNVAWTGAGQAPRRLLVVESVEDPSLSNVILERSIEASWDGREFSWERDGTLRPGSYLWRVAVHDDNGKVLASSIEKVEVPFPHHEEIAVSSLVVGNSCREDAPPGGLRTRPPGVAKVRERPALTFDPMRAAECRVKPNAGSAFQSPATLHAFVRIYPVERLEKHRPESWQAHFTLRPAEGAPGGEETSRQIAFTSDSGSGYLAAVAIPLDGVQVHAGAYRLDVAIGGPGVRSELHESRSILISSPGALTSMRP